MLHLQRYEEEMTAEFTSKIATYDIDLNRPEDERWAEVIQKEKRVARKLARQALDDYPRWLTTVVGGVFKTAYAVAEGRFVGEIDAWSDALDVTPGEATLVNCSYELSHAAEWMGNPWGVFGCTAGIRAVQGDLVHVRSMDWELAGIGNATRIFRFHGGQHEFVSVGIVGFVGVLSGMVPGAYSVTINWAPPAGLPSFAFGPAFLLREVLETCATYDEAVAKLRSTALSTPVFFTVCGAKPGQACVIERTANESSIRKLDDAVLVQANHHVVPRFRSHNACMDDGDDDDEDLQSRLSYSKERAEALSDALSALPESADLKSAAECLDEAPVLNCDTYQQMLFVPRTGELRVWRWVS
jgi:hypothetical protein